MSSPPDNSMYTSSYTFGYTSSPAVAEEEESPQHALSPLLSAPSYSPSPEGGDFQDGYTFSSSSSSSMLAAFILSPSHSASPHPPPPSASFSLTSASDSIPISDSHYHTHAHAHLLSHSTSHFYSHSESHFHPHDSSPPLLSHPIPSLPASLPPFPDHFDGYAVSSSDSHHHHPIINFHNDSPSAPCCSTDLPSSSPHPHPLDMLAGLGMSTGDDDLSACLSPGDLSFNTAMSPTISDPFVVEDNYLVDLYHAYASTQPPESIRSSTETTSDGSTAASYYTTRDIKLNAYVRDIPVVSGDSSGTHLTVSGDAVANQLYTPPPSPLRHIPIADLEASSPHSTSGAAPSDTAQNTAASEPSVMPRFFHMKWNDYFQRMLELPEETQEEQVRKCVWISTIAKDFTYTAKVIAKTIIREYHIDPLLKTIKPIDVGGQAGGPKYVWHDIIFKFAVDWKKIYRGDEFAQKAASHELKSAMRYYRLDPQLRIPLLALIDYRGHRMIAESILPLSHQTIRYGSNDGGKTIHNSDSQLAKIMRKCSRKLNIAGHQVANKHLHGPFDIEGHLGTDGHYYLVDFARIFPPVYEPRIDIKHTYLYHLFRPEFLKNYPIPLSSDAFSLMAAEPSLECNQQVVVASDYLREGVIPRFARYLEALEDVN
ncbi:MAG: hypothetical protein Q8P67_08865, partial [archaeon]|nr:hypothetical protein [archaeon]